jgi:CubicO group peptidase (beta-lactamase class C family)
VQVGVKQSASSLGLAGFRVEWGLGVRKFAFSSGESVRKTAFGHGGMGGSIALCDPAENFSIAVTLNKLTLTSDVSTRLIDLVSTELGVGSFIRYGYTVADKDGEGIF